jgi:5-methylcytosine-specific restriction endonuclease McrA
MYCGARMGKAQMSIDHFIPLELGGANNTSNYLTACRRCNKDKGSMPPREWCEMKGLDYDGLIQYLLERLV